MVKLAANDCRCLWCDADRERGEAVYAARVRPALVAREPTEYVWWRGYLGDVEGRSLGGFARDRDDAARIGPGHVNRITSAVFSFVRLERARRRRRRAA